MLRYFRLPYDNGEFSGKNVEANILVSELSLSGLSGGK